jgi:hypothetical protein
MDKLIIIVWITLSTFFVYNIFPSNYIIFFAGISITNVLTHKEKIKETYENDKNIDKWIKKIQTTKNDDDRKHALIQLKDYQSSIDGRFDKKKLDQIIEKYEKNDEVYECNMEDFNPFSIATAIKRKGDDVVLKN